MKLNVEKIKDIIEEKGANGSGCAFYVEYTKDDETIRITTQIERNGGDIKTTLRIKTKEFNSEAEYYEADTPEVIEIYKYMASKTTYGMEDLFVE